MAATPSAKRPTGRRGGGWIAVAVALLLGGVLPAQAAEVICHYVYGGESVALRVSGVASVFEVPAIRVGSYFLFRPVFQEQPADQASVKVYVYVDRADGPALIHQGSWPYPPAQASAAAHGFTGLQRVYEPIRDSELEYWCAR